MDLKKYLSEQKKIVDLALQNYFANLDCPKHLCEAMAYSLSAGGKRLRPILVMASAQACGGSNDKVMPIAISLEMIHTFSLIHDDLPAMDDDDLRRGIPTNHKVFGEAMAILSGDGLLAEAFRCLAKNNVRNDIVSDIALATGPMGMVGGQVLDLEAQDKDISHESLETIHRAKTGALLIVSVTSGAKASYANDWQLAALKKYAENIGLAFQIADDILDIEGTEKEIGKPVGSDIENKKSTYPAIVGMEESKRLEKQLVKEAVSLLSKFDHRAEPLREIAKYIVERRD